MTKYYIVVYDVEVKRVNKIYKLLKQYLFWMQNSVFEGYLEQKKYKYMLKQLNKILDKNKDFILIYEIPSHKMIKRKILGKIKKEYTNVM